MDHACIHEIDETMRFVGSLWTRWKPTRQQDRAWRRAVGVLNQCELRAAIEEVYLESKRLQPTLGVILDKYRASSQRVRQTQQQFSDEEIKQVEHEAEEILDDLLERDPQQLRAVLTEALSRLSTFTTGCFDRVKCRSIAKELIQSGTAPDDVRQWPTLLRGFTWAALEEQSKP